MSFSDIELLKSQKASKLHHWFKSSGHFSDGVDLPIGGVESGRVCACSLRSTLVSTPSFKVNLLMKFLSSFQVFYRLC